MRTTLTLDEDAYRSALTLAQVSGRPLGKVVSQLIRRGLQASPNVRTDTPTFSVPPGTPMIPGNLVQDLLDDEA